MHVWEKQRESVCKTEGEDGGGRERGEKKSSESEETERAK